jgi:hypothetical protein
MTSLYAPGQGEDPNEIAPSTWPPFGTEGLPFGADMLPFGMRTMPTEVTTLARWRAAEGSLYSIVMVDPELYETAVTLVVEAAQVLRAECDSLEDLLDLDVARVLARCGTAAQLAEAGVNPATAIDAARARRVLELHGAPPFEPPAGSFAEGGR